MYAKNSVNWLNIFFLSHNFFCTTRQLFRLLSLSFSMIFLFLQLFSTSLQKKSSYFLYVSIA